MSLKQWLMFLVPTVGSLLTCLLSVTGNNIVLIIMAALVAGLTGIVPQLPDNFLFLGRKIGSAETGNRVLRDVGLGFATGCFSFVITYLLPMMLFGRAIDDALYGAGIYADDYQMRMITDAIWVSTLIGTVPLNALIGATIIANAQRPWLAALIAGFGFATTSVTVSVLAIAESASRLAANPLLALGIMFGVALVVAITMFAGAFARDLILRPKASPAVATADPPAV
jgi:hypothetical protein